VTAAGNSLGIDAGYYTADAKFGMRFFSSAAYEQMFCFHTAGVYPTAQSSLQSCPWILSSTLLRALQPLQIGAGGTAIAQSTVYSPNITPAAVPAQSCADQTFTVTGLVVTDTLSRLTPPAALGNVGLGDAYPSAANTLLLHFCNPSAANVTPPAGVYGFRATH
ncbi:MAG: hypothetical protein JOZ58_16175, partial [Acetobacteraceae bacterium]|nr:hypothetical protein [Acetobacteraceae bacterium]